MNLICKIMNELIKVDKVFSLNNFEENEKKAFEILLNIEGESLKEKLKTLNDISFTFNISNKDDRDIANKYKNQMVNVKTALSRRAKEIRDNINLEIKEVIKQEKEYLGLFSEGELTLKEKIDEYDRFVAREERRVSLPVRLRMLKEIELEMNEDDILDLDEKQFPAFYYEKKAEYDLKKQNEILKEIENKHKQRFEIIVEKGLFEFLNDKYQKFGELSDNDFLILIENCEKRKEEVEEERQIEIEKAKKEAIENEKKSNETQQKLEEEKREHEARFNAWKKANLFNDKTDFIKFEENKATMWRKISVIEF